MQLTPQRLQEAAADPSTQWSGLSGTGSSWDYFTMTADVDGHVATYNAQYGTISADGLAAAVSPATRALLMTRIRELEAARDRAA